MRWVRSPLVDLLNFLFFILIIRCRVCGAPCSSADSLPVHPCWRRSRCGRSHGRAPGRGADTRRRRVRAGRRQPGEHRRGQGRHHEGGTPRGAGPPAARPREGDPLQPRCQAQMQVGDQRGLARMVLQLGSRTQDAHRAGVPTQNQTQKRSGCRLYDEQACVWALPMELGPSSVSQCCEVFLLNGEMGDKMGERSGAPSASGPRLCS